VRRIVPQRLHRALAGRALGREPPSRCPRCERPIRWYENVPIVGWLALRARCAGCAEPISAVYPAVELLVGLGWLVAYLAFGPTFEAVRVAVFGTVLLGIAATDARHYLIPDGFTVFLLLWALGTSIASQAPGGTTLFAGPYEAFIGACVGAGAISIIGWLGELAFKKEAMGFGDVTMMAAVGAALGAERALLTVVTGAFLGRGRVARRDPAGDVRAAPPGRRGRRGRRRRRGRGRLRAPARPVRRLPCACGTAHIASGRRHDLLVLHALPLTVTIGDMLRPPAEGGVLARFTRDLTAEAHAGRLDPIRCRAAEIDRLVDILLRHGKNNPALVGPAGVGKTAIVEGLAERTAQGRVPFALRGVRILSLDHVSLLAGTTYRGQYEERLRGIVAECSASDDVVLFIDELHNLIGQGTAMGTAMDAGNMLKPALTRGDFRVIGATTDDEYERWVCGDPALERRFQKITVRELSGDETMEILRARQSTLERHHGVVIADEALDAALRLTDLHVTDRMRPDRALDVLDEAVRPRAGGRRALAVGRGAAPRAARPRARAAPRAPPSRGRVATTAEERAPRGTRARAPARGDDGRTRWSRWRATASPPSSGSARSSRRCSPTGRRTSGVRARRAPPAGRRRARRARRRARRGSPRWRRSSAARLPEEGAVVRGVDVARVVAVATGARGQVAVVRRAGAPLRLRGRGARARGVRAARASTDLAGRRASCVPEVERAMGRKFRTPPRVEVQPRGEVRKYIERQLHRPACAARAAGQESAYKRLGLIPETLDPARAVPRAARGAGGGLLRSEVEGAVRGEGSDPDLAPAIIRHELVHALQDQYVNLDSLLHVEGPERPPDGGAGGDRGARRLGAARPGQRRRGAARRMDRIREQIRNNQDADARCSRRRRSPSASRCSSRI
jgi:prepilin signal peptidase PulO-like enzyme (type II secretory pathway)/MoxR-like ATPase